MEHQLRLEEMRRQQLQHERILQATADKQKTRWFSQINLEDYYTDLSAILQMITGVSPILHDFDEKSETPV